MKRLKLQKAVERETVREQAAELQIDSEKKKLLELEEAISPRVLEQSRSSEKLAKFKGMRYAIKVVDGADLETRFMAGQLRFMLNMAHWTEDPSMLSLGQYGPTDEEGITIEYNPRIAVMEGNVQPDAVTDDQASTLMDILRENKIKFWELARGLSTSKPGLPPSVIIIHVGLKPVRSYFINERGIAPDSKGNKIGGNSWQGTP
jgi:hypothetical protein